jgi:hypothetical protein
VFANVSLADSIRIATFNPGLKRTGAGLLLQDIQSGNDLAVLKAVEVIDRVSPDILLLTGFDYDAGLVALSAFAKAIRGPHGYGVNYPYRFAFRPNTGMSTGMDLDHDGRLGGPGDAQGFGYFSGQNGMAILSRFPVDAEAAKDFSDQIWQEQSWASLPKLGSEPYYTSEEAGILRLASIGLWDVPILLPDGGELHLYAMHLTTPALDGPEDRNGVRNRDEVKFWQHYIQQQPKTAGFVLSGIFNLDPEKGDGFRTEMASLLADPRIAALNPVAGDGSSNTASWPTVDSPLRVDYVLPSANTRVLGSGVFWPTKDQPGHNLVSGQGAAAHHLVWADIDLNPQIKTIHKHHKIKPI